MSFFGELRRRNVFRVGIAYLAAVWALIQVADVVLPNVGAPTWIIQALIFSSALGFPLALVLAWFYEWTPEGIKAASALEASESVSFSGRKLDFAIIGLLVVAVGFLLVGRLGAVEPSIAVLPFSNESAEDENAEFFAYGMHNELLTQLGKISALTVTGRSSVMEYLNSLKSVREIGRELDVATLLLGQVQRTGDRVRINVQLVDAERDRQLWSATYDDEITAENIFGIQSEMATTIASELNAALTPEEVTRLNERPTQNTQAWIHYQNGVYFANHEDEPTYLPRAVEEFRLAVDLDREFTLAWAELSRVHSQRFILGHDTSDAVLASSREAVEQAHELAPDSPDVHLAWGAYYAAAGDNERSLAEIALASQGRPNDAELYTYLFLRYRRMNRWDEAIEAAERAEEEDPRNNAGASGWIHNWLRNYDLAVEGLDEYRRVWPDDAEAYATEAQSPLWWYGDFASTKAAAASPEVPLGAVRMRMGWIAALYEDNYAEARRYANGMEDLYSGDRRYIPKESYIGVTHQVFGRPELARPFFEDAEARARAAIEGNNRDARYYVTLAEALLGLGHIEEAVQSAREAMQLMPRSCDAVAGSRIQRDAIVRVLAPAGDVDAVIAELGDYLDNPGQWSLEGLLPDPRFDPVEEHPDFQAFVESRQGQ